MRATEIYGISLLVNCFVSAVIDYSLAMSVRSLQAAVEWKMVAIYVVNIRVQIFQNVA